VLRAAIGDRRIKLTGVAYAEQFSHLCVKEALSGTVGLDPLSVKDELRNRMLADILKNLVSGSGGVFNVYLGEGDVVLGEEALGFTAVAAPRCRIYGQDHEISLRHPRRRRVSQMHLSRSDPEAVAITLRRLGRLSPDFRDEPEAYARRDSGQGF
jgi:hypothetical protein